MKKLLYKNEADIQRRGGEVAERLLELHPSLVRDPLSFLAVPIMQGGLPWSKDVLQPLADEGILFPTQPLTIKGRYTQGTMGKGTIQVVTGPSKADIEGKSILILEDIVDEGHTLQGIVEYLNLFAPAQIIISALCEKTAFRKVQFAQLDPSLIGFRYSGKKWFIGHGMDVSQLGRDYRHLYLIDPLR